MPTIGELVERLMPIGTEYGAVAAGTKRPRNPGWDTPPWWPPDLFAVAATLVRFSECYAHPDVRGGIGLGKNHPRACERLGALWRQDPDSAPTEQWIRTQWSELRRNWNTPIQEYTDRDRLAPWSVAALRLMAVADEASSGIGFGGKSVFAQTAEVIGYENFDQSLCWLVDQGECCVQPKGRTPQVGCNVRSLSLHLALLPSVNMVTTVHVNPVTTPRKAGRLGVLLVPFPYFVRDSEFQARAVRGQKWGRLGLRCSWGRRPSSGALSAFVAELIDQARAHKRKVDVLVFPELALSKAQHQAIWKTARAKGVGLFLAGVHSRGDTGARNLAVGSLADRRQRDVASWDQAKHHRWRIERNQIEAYGLKLNADRFWWEDIDVTARTVVATRFTRGGTIACLVCEDLARVEPVQPALREMGPSLIVALLMDGPQLTGRWSAQSATVFSEDPGSSVLTFTSLGLLRRTLTTRGHDGPASASIALWREPGGAPVPLLLAPDAHAIHVSLKLGRERELTLDGRDDHTAAEVYRLDNAGGQGCRSIAHPAPPPWAASLYRSPA